MLFASMPLMAANTAKPSNVVKTNKTSGNANKVQNKEPSAFAQLDGVLQNSLISGEFSLHMQYGDKAIEGNNGFDKDDDYAFMSGFFNILYSTGKLYDTNINMGASGKHAFWQIDDGFGYADGAHTKAVIHTANIAYSNQYFDAVFGRQKLNLVWFDSYGEALAGTIKIIPDATIKVGYATRFSILDDDKPLFKFMKIKEHGVFFADGIYKTPLKGLFVNPYLYYSHDSSAWTGVKVDYDTVVNDFKTGGTVHAAYSKEEEDGMDNSYLLHLEGRGSFYDIDAALGIIKAFNDVGNMKTTGEHIKPFEYGGCQVFNYDAFTVYTTADYRFKDFLFRGVYGYTTFEENSAHQLEISANYDITKHFKAKTYITHARGDIEYNQVILGATYTF
jgi:hypothetical protein